MSQKNVNSSKLKAVINLERIGNPKAVPYLINSIDDKKFPYKFAAIHALANLGGSEATDFLKKLWKQLETNSNGEPIDKDHQYIKAQQVFVAAALYRLGIDENIEFVYDLINSKNKALRYNVVSALGMVNSKKSKELLYHVLKNDNMDLPRYGAAKSLVELNEPNIRCTIQKIINEGKLPPDFFEQVLK